MPIYEFACKSCGRDSELLVRSAEWKGTTCPHCGSKQLEKKFSVFASSGGEVDAAPACGMRPSAGCGCGRGGPHRH